MKKFLLLITLFLITTALGYSQSQRLVMFEEFTQASCGPCAQQNAVFDPLLLNNLDKATSVRYHTSWPGVDPMWQQNPVDVAARVTYYNVNAVPFCFMDGVAPTGPNYTGAPANVTQSTIDAEYAVPSSFNLSMYQYLSAGQDSIYVNMLGQCTQAASGTLVAQLVIIEKHIHFSTPPGTNGETDFYNVMKKMLPTAAGTTLPSSFQPGDYFIIQGAWKLANIYSMSQLSAVGFIQNNAGKSILQSANSSDSIPLTMPFNNDVQLMGTSNVSTTNCSGTVAPMVTIRNNGNHNVTSMTIKYLVNGGAPATYTWNGNLGTLKQTTISLPTYNFTPEATDALIIYADQVNNVPDEYPFNDTTKINIVTPPPTTTYALLGVRTDSLPQQISWALRNSYGIVIDTSTPYTLPLHFYTDTLHLNGQDCFTFTIHDSGGDGICCNHGSGVYQIKSATGTIIKQGGSFGYYESTELTNWLASIEQFEKSSLKVYPNPFSGEAKVTFYLMNPEDVILTLYNATGQLVRSYDKGNFPAGNQECTIDANSLPTGIYMLKLQAGSQTNIFKISVNN